MYPSNHCHVLIGLFCWIVKNNTKKCQIFPVTDGRLSWHQVEFRQSTKPARLVGSLSGFFSGVPRWVVRFSMPEEDSFVEKACFFSP